MGRTDGIPIIDYIERYISIIVVNRTFTLESFLAFSDYFETIMTRPKHPTVMNQSQLDLYNVITLRANFLAPPSVIERIMEIYYRINQVDLEKPFGNFKRYIYRLVLKADLFILKQLSTGNINEEISHKIPLFARSVSVLSACQDCPSIGSIQETLTANCGPEIIFPENGLYIITLQKGQRNFIYYRHPGSKYRYYYLTLPSTFLYQAGERVNKRGILLIRSEIAASFIADIDKFPPEKPIAINFWFYGLKHKIKQLSLARNGSDFILNESVLATIKRESPELFQMNGVHERDRIRKRKYGGKMFLEIKIPKLWHMDDDAMENHPEEKGGDKNVKKTDRW
jgi:hypothetical protein